MGLFFKTINKSNDELGRFDLRHLIGLEIPTSIYCEVIVYKDKLVMQSESKEFNLKIEKICSVDFDMNLDIERYTKSSIAKGIIGAVAFGTVGAIVGSTPKTKEKKAVTCKAIINYENSFGESSYIIFEDLEANVVKGAAKLVDTLRSIIKPQEKQKIEL